MSRTRRGGFTLVEILMVVTVVAVLAVMVAPSLQDDDRLRLLAASAVLTSDLEVAQVVNITDTDRSIVVCFDPDRNRYWLASPSPSPA